MDNYVVMYRYIAIIVCIAIQCYKKPRVVIVHVVYSSPDSPSCIVLKPLLHLFPASCTVCINVCIAIHDEIYSKFQTHSQSLYTGPN